MSDFTASGRLDNIEERLAEYVVSLGPSERAKAEDQLCSYYHLLRSSTSLDEATLQLIGSTLLVATYSGSTGMSPLLYNSLLESAQYLYASPTSAALFEIAEQESAVFAGLPATPSHIGRLESALSSDLLDYRLAGPIMVALAGHAPGDLANNWSMFWRRIGSYPSSYDLTALTATVTRHSGIDAVANNLRRLDHSEAGLSFLIPLAFMPESQFAILPPGIGELQSGNAYSISDHLTGEMMPIAGSDVRALAETADFIMFLMCDEYEAGGWTLVRAPSLPEAESELLSVEALRLDPMPALP